MASAPLALSSLRIALTAGLPPTSSSASAVHSASAFSDGDAGDALTTA